MNTPMVALASAAVAALSLAACAPPHAHHEAALPMKSIAALDCPGTQGDLTRQSAAADGKTCVYGDDEGAQVTLQLVSLTGDDTAAALAPIETRLRAEMPLGAENPKNVEGGDKVDIDLPGIHIHAHDKSHGSGNGDHVTIGNSVSIDGDNVTVNGGKSGGAGVVVDAQDQGAEIHINEGGGGVRRTFILASDTPGPHGYRMAGYEARGPEGGPIVVASVLGKTDDHDALRHDIHRLLRLNVGG